MTLDCGDGQDNDKTMTGVHEGNYEGMGYTQPEVSPNTAVGTKGSLGTAEGNMVRKYSTDIEKDSPIPQNESSTKTRWPYGGTDEY